MKAKFILFLIVLLLTSCIKPKSDLQPQIDDSTNISPKNSVVDKHSTHQEKHIENSKTIAVVLFEAQCEKYYVIERNSEEWKLKFKVEPFDREAKQVNTSVPNSREQKKLQIVNQIIQEINSKSKKPDKLYFIANSKYQKDEDVKEYKDIIEKEKKETFEYYREEDFRGDTISHAIQFALSKKLDN